MPLELADFTGDTAAEYAEFRRARNRWMADHGIPRDWPTQHALLKRSRAAYGLPDTTAAGRARLAAETRARLADEARGGPFGVT